MNSIVKRSVGKLAFSLFSILTLLATSIVAPAVALSSSGVHLSAPFSPALLKGMVVQPSAPLSLEFLVDAGESGLQGGALTEETTRLVKYFLASVAMPETDLWVNLSPHEENRIIEKAFGETEMGQELLRQDQALKQLTAGLIDPESATGREFWNRVYSEASARFGHTDLPIETAHRVWILPDRAVVYRNGTTVMVKEARLKVMLETDYLAMKGNLPAVTDSADVSSQVLREVLVPVLTREVNTGKNFAALRQVFNALILANWYKTHLKKSLLAGVYADTRKTAGIALEDADAAIRRIYSGYLEAARNGSFHYIREEEDPATGEILPRKYFSGGLDFSMEVEEEGEWERSGDSGKEGYFKIPYQLRQAAGDEGFFPLLPLDHPIELNGDHKKFFYQSSNGERFVVGVNPRALTFWDRDNADGAPLRHELIYADPAWSVRLNGIVFKTTTVARQNYLIAQPREPFNMEEYGEIIGPNRPGRNVHPVTTPEPKDGTKTLSIGSELKTIKVQISNFRDAPVAPIEISFDTAGATVKVLNDEDMYIPAPMNGDQQFSLLHSYVDYLSDDSLEQRPDRPNASRQPVALLFIRHGQLQITPMEGNSLTVSGDDAMASGAPVGGIDLGEGQYVQVVDQDADGLPVFDPVDLERLAREVKGYFPVPVGHPVAVSLESLLNISSR